MTKSRATWRDAAIDTFAALFNSGGAGTIQFRDGSTETHPEDSANGTLLATVTFSATAFAAASAGVAAANAITSGTVTTGGTTTHFRALNGSGVCGQVGSVTVTGGGGDIEIDDPVLILGNLVAVDSAAIALAEGT